jgi:hypothetical protein
MEFLTIIFWIVGVIMLWRMISNGFALGHRIAVASETTALSTAALYYALTPEAKERADAAMAAKAKVDEERTFAAAATRDKKNLIKTAVLIGGLFLLVMLTGYARAESTVQRDQPTTTFRDSSGRTLGTATTNSSGQTTFRNSRGQTTGTASVPPRRGR